MRFTLWFFSLLGLIFVIGPISAQESIRFEERTLSDAYLT